MTEFSTFSNYHVVYNLLIYFEDVRHYMVLVAPPKGSDLIRSLGHMMPNFRGVWPTGRRRLIFHFMLLPVGVKLGLESSDSAFPLAGNHV